MEQSRLRSIVLITAVLVGLTVVVLAWQDPAEPNEPYIPSGWSLISKEGQIASVCIGTWSECGQIRSTYRITQPEESIGDLANKLEAAGWFVESEGDSSLSALRDDEDARISAQLEGFQVKLIYVER